MTAMYRSNRPARSVGWLRISSPTKNIIMAPKRGLRAGISMSWNGSPSRPPSSMGSGMDLIPIIASSNRLPLMPSAYMPN